jgi:quercetin dioxygenase-like cupin family protein
MVIARRHAIGALAALFELAATAARAQTPQAASSRPVFKQDLPNITLDNWEVTVSHVDYPPGYVGKSHQHRGILFAYVLEGTVVSQILGEGVPREERTYRAGEMFYEPIGSTHQVAKNTSDTSPARLLVFNLTEKVRP